MAGIRGTKWVRLNPWTRFWKVTVPNFVNDIRIKRWAEKNGIHRGQIQILKGGVWEDHNCVIYNCMGDAIGKVEWFEGFRG